jgi:threonine/homoserine efflux transporter RhtA
MFALLLGSALALGAGLLASASLSEGALVASRTAAQVIGWLLLASPLLALGRLQRRLTELSAAGIAFSAGAAILYVAYFEWGKTPSFPEANAAEVVPSVAAGPVSMPVAVAIRGRSPDSQMLREPAESGLRPRIAPPVVATESHAIPYSPPY